MRWRPRIYRTDKMFAARHLRHYHGFHWDIQLGTWIFTTRPFSSRNRRHGLD